LKFDSLITGRENGLYCTQGRFYIDPSNPAECALITHAHADHARRGSSRYISTTASGQILRARLGKEINLTTVEYGEKIKLGKVWVSFHPAGHVLGSAQIRVESHSEVWVVSGDYKRACDPTCEPFEVVPCDCFITEATFGLPVYSWRPGEEIAREICDWWQAETKTPSILFCYALGKTQRVLSELTRFTNRKVFLHGSAATVSELYRSAGIQMLEWSRVSSMDRTYDFNGDLIVAPPSAHRSLWMKRFKESQRAFASGWMQLRGMRRRRGYETGFVLSDHADWEGLVNTVKETGARRVFTVHGQAELLAQYLREALDIDAQHLAQISEGEEDE
jgi:putative mRNA 3-end processing factor